MSLICLVFLFSDTNQNKSYNRKPSLSVTGCPFQDEIHVAIVQVDSVHQILMVLYLKELTDKRDSRLSR